MITQGKVLEEVQEARCIEFGNAALAVMVVGNEDTAKEVAALIAAAPELLEALKNLLAEHTIMNDELVKLGRGVNADDVSPAGMAWAAIEATK